MERQELRTKKSVSWSAAKRWFKVQQMVSQIDVNRYSAKDRIKILCNVQYRSPYSHIHSGIITLQYYMYLACAGYRNTHNIASFFVLQSNQQTLGGYMRFVARQSASLYLRRNANTLRPTCKTARILHIALYQIVCSCLLKYISN